MMEANIVNVIFRLLKELQISVTRSSIVVELNTHPQNNTLMAISDLLSYWNIPNGAYEMSIDELIKSDLTFPFLTHFSSGNGEFILVHRIDQQFAIITNNRSNKSKIDINEFKQHYSGTILIAKKDEFSGEAEYHSKRMNEMFSNVRLPLASILLLIVFIAYYSMNSLDLRSLLIPLLLLIKGTGLVICLILVGHVVDSGNPFIKKVCGKINSNCTVILNSDAAKITTWLSWSEIGFFYFSGTLLATFLSITYSYFLPFIFLLTLLGLPYTFFSFYYQWRVAKAWCVLCTTIQILLWLEFFIFLMHLNVQMMPLGIREISLFTFCLLIPVLIWIIVKPYLFKIRNTEHLIQHLNSFKFNEVIFTGLLNAEPAYHLLNDKCLILSDSSNVGTIVTLVSNPYCPACAVAHKKLGWAMERSDIRLQIIFAVTDYRDQIIQHIMALALKGDKRFTRDALNDWYERKQKSYDDWIAKYPAKSSSNGTKMLKKQAEWCETAKISSTPTIFINGRKMPESYNPEEIKYLI